MCCPVLPPGSLHGRGLADAVPVCKSAEGAFSKQIGSLDHRLGLGAWLGPAIGLPRAQGGPAGLVVTLVTLKRRFLQTPYYSLS